MELWTDYGYTWSFTWCGVGSRDFAPETPNIENTVIWIGHCLALIGGVLCTGDAIGSDAAFKVGYDIGRKESPYNLPPAQVYYTRLKNQRGLTQNAREGQHELESYPDSKLIAQEIAYEARGSFEGLFPSGIALHTRNAFQVLSETLQNPRKFTVLYAKPVGKKLNVKGGTNTANKISLKNKIPVVNLWVDVERDNFIDWLTRQLVNRNIPVPPLRSNSHASTTET
jgi:hypothetical protein